MKKLKDFLCVFLIFTFTFLTLQIDSISASEKQELVSLDYKNAELSSVLRSLSYSYNLNLVATKNLKGNVTVSLRDITIEEAFRFTVSGGVIVPGANEFPGRKVSLSTDSRRKPIEQVTD